MLNISAMAFQQRYDRKEDDQDFDPFVIEMTDLHVLKYLKNTWYFDFPVKPVLQFETASFVNNNMGFGQQYTFSAKPGLSTCLKFVLINYIGFYEPGSPSMTYYINRKSGN
jgi:hypothetical protein